MKCLLTASWNEDRWKGFGVSVEKMTEGFLKFQQILHHKTYQGIAVLYVGESSPAASKNQSA